MIVNIADELFRIDNKSNDLFSFFRDYIVDDESMIKSESIKIIENGNNEIEIFRQVNNHLCSKKKILFHGVSIKQFSSGLVILGPSGSGKTTLAKKMICADSKSQIICDDKIIIGMKGERLVAWSTPWLGKEHIGSNDVIQIDKIIVTPIKNNLIIMDEKLKVDIILKQIMPITLKSIINVADIVDFIVKNVPFYQ